MTTAHSAAAKSELSTAAAPDSVPVPVLLAFTRDVLGTCGMPPDDAASVAETMIEADLVGMETHGIIRLAQYAVYLANGDINTQPNITLAEEGPATAVVDGDNGMGHLVMRFAAQQAVRLAKQSGIGWVGTRRSNHAGAGGIYAAIPLEHGMIGIYGAASSANHMAVHGGAEPMLGTNPIAFAVPAGQEAPVVLDVATSVSSFGVIRKYMMEGKDLPEGWVVDRSGNPITEAKRATEGVLLPIGGHKGSGLAMIIGLLSGPLNRAAFGRDVREFGGAGGGGETNTGQFVVALDVSRFLPLDVFKTEIDRHIRDFRNSATLPGVDGIRVPGGERLRKRTQRLREGVRLSAALTKQLDELAGRMRVAPLAERR